MGERGQKNGRGPFSRRQVNRATTSAFLWGVGFRRRGDAVSWVASGLSRWSLLMAGPARQDSNPKRKRGTASLTLRVMMIRQLVNSNWTDH
jgi:hypothetical protein